MLKASSARKMIQTVLHGVVYGLVWLVGSFAWADEASLLVPQILPDKSYSETFTVMFAGVDGTYIQGQLGVSNLGFKKAGGVCRILLITPNKPPYSQAKTMGRDAWSHVPKSVDGSFKKSPEILKMGTCRLTATHNALQLMVHLDDISVRINLHQPAQRVVPPGHPVIVGKAFYHSDILVTPTEADAVLAVAHDKPPESLVGFGYADHSQSTTLPLALARGWVRFRGFSPHCGRLLLVRYPSLATAAPVAYLWRQAKEQEPANAPEALTQLRLKLPAVNASAFRMVATYGEQQSITIEAKKELIRQEPLEDYGPLANLIKHWVGAVVSQTYTAVYSDSQGCQNVPGILEVDHIDG